MLLTKGKKTGLALLDGDPPSEDLLSACLSDCETFICADGAANRELPRRPDAIVGDMDSIEQAPTSVPLIRVEDPDLTDSEKCIHYLTGHACDRIILLGGVGGRQDHHLVNLALPLSQPGKILLAGDDFWAMGVEGHQRFELPPKRGLSIFPLHGPARGVSLRGVKYPLESVDLAFTRGLSAANQTLESVVEIELLEGRLLLIVERRPSDTLWQADR
jgi:thiamine pyrophosphokinase